MNIASYRQPVNLALADYCVRWAVEGLVARGFRVTDYAALTRGISRQIDALIADEWSGCAVRLVEAA